MIETTKQTLKKLQELLSELDPQIYSQSVQSLSGASIGQHYRHTIELFQSMIRGYDSGVISYDKRDRNKLIETNLQIAGNAMSEIINDLDKVDKTIVLESELSGNVYYLNSNYYREVLYNLEHTIHHQALIRIGIEAMTDIVLSAEFGVAPSTIQYREKCAQ